MLVLILNILVVARVIDADTIDDSDNDTMETASDDIESPIVDIALSIYQSLIAFSMKHYGHGNRQNAHNDLINEPKIKFKLVMNSSLTSL